MMQTTALWHDPGSLLWTRDNYLRRLEPLFDSFRLVSLDVFDTLLLRSCAEPGDVFERTAREAQRLGLFGRPTTAAEFRTLRQAAERLAREHARNENGSDEATLEQIYERLPAKLGDRRRLLALELETERETCWVNPNVASLIRFCRARRIRVALLSDMYLSSGQLVSILAANGLDPALLDLALVSSEAGCGKRSGELFDVLLNRFPDVRPEQVIHIGDNETADVLGAAKRGIRAIHYAVVPAYIDSPFHWEAVRHGKLLPELLSLRKLIAATEPPAPTVAPDGAVLADKEASASPAGMARSTGAVPASRPEAASPDGFFYRFGAAVLGPFVQGLCDWALDICAAERRTEIHPLMREAHLLGPALANAARMRGLQIAVRPLYVSRQATLLAAMNDFTERELDRVLALGPITVGETLDMLGIDAREPDCPALFRQHLHTAVEETRFVPAGDESDGSPGTLHDAFKRYLLQEPAKTRVRGTIARQRRLLLDYIRRTCEFPGKLLTLDLGFNGTIQAALDAAFDGEGSERDSVHLLAVGTERAAELPLRGTDLRCWLEAGGDNDDMARRFARSPGLIEELMMGPFGSTVRYERECEAEPDQAGHNVTKHGADNGETGESANSAAANAGLAERRTYGSGAEKGLNVPGAGGGEEGGDCGRGPIRPVLARLAIPAEQFGFKRACQQGVFAFQSGYERWRAAKPQLARRFEAREWGGVLHRALDMPTPEEAARLGDLVHQDNFGGVQVTRLCEPPALNWQSRGGDYLIDLAAFGPKTANILWPQGTVTRDEPYRLYKSFLRLGDSFGSAVLAFNLMERLTREGITAVYIYGKGDFARRLFREALLHRIRVAAVIEPDEAKLAEEEADAAGADLRRLEAEEKQPAPPYAQEPHAAKSRHLPPPSPREGDEAGAAPLTALRDNAEDAAAPPNALRDNEAAAAPQTAREPATLREAIGSDREAGHVYAIGTLTDIAEYKQAILDGYKRLRPGAAPRLYEPFA